MILKAVSLFLIFILVLGMFGKLRVPKIGMRKPKELAASKCPACGTISAGKSPCPCGGKSGPSK